MEEVKKIGFFSRLKIALVKLEEYVKFLEEKVSVAVKYFLIVTLIFTLFLTAIELHDTMKVVNKGYEYIKNELVEFSYEDGMLVFSENVEAYDQEMDFYFLVDTSEQLSEEQINNYKQKIKSFGVLLLKDKMFYYSNGSELESDYKSMSKQYEITNLNKEQLIEKIDSIGIVGIGVTLFFTLVVSLYVVNLIKFFMDWILITIFAYCAIKICKINMNFKQAFIISIYSLTLSIILSIIYNILNYLTGFYTPYFRIMYLLISYVYVVAVLFMIKSDLVKQKIEVQKVEEVQKEIHEELNNQEKNNNEDKNKDLDNGSEENQTQNEKENDDILGEPDGSEI